jgi:hypothetical protein
LERHQCKGNYRHRQLQLSRRNLLHPQASGAA